MDVQKTMGSVKKSRMGRTRLVSQNARKLGTLSVDSYDNPVKPDMRAAERISRRKILEGRDSFIARQSKIDSADTAADIQNTHVLGKTLAVHEIGC